METFKFIFPAILILGILTFVSALIGFIVWSGRARSRRQDAALAGARDGGLTADARIVDARAARLQRSDEFTLFKVHLEIAADEGSTAPYSAVCVWEVEPSAVASMTVGTVLRVRADRANLRRVFPDFAGARWSVRYQNALLGIEDEFRPEELIDARGAAPLAPRADFVYRRRSKTVLFGLPLWEVAFNLSGKNRRARYARAARARAIIAIGDNASGFIAIGSFARGFIAIGQFSLGVVSLGTGGIGLFAASVMPVGGVAVGAIATGLVALGGIAVGIVGAGFLPIARYVVTPARRSVEVAPFYDALKNALAVSDQTLRAFAEYGVTGLVAASFLFFIGWFIVLAILIRRLEPNSNRL